MRRAWRRNRESARAASAGRAPAAVLGTLLALVSGCRDADAPASLLARGNAAFAEGKYEEAAKLYESEEDREDLLARRFNAGVSWSRARKADQARERFEEVAARADGELRGAAFYNAGHASFEKAKAIAGEAVKEAESKKKVERLAEAAKAYAAASQFFREVRPATPDAEHNIAVVKTALRGVADLIARLEAEEKAKAEEEALKSPPELLRALEVKERLHRALSRSLAREPGARSRLGARRLRKSEAENRALAEKLHHQLTKPPEPPAAAPGGQPEPQPAPEPGEEEKARKAHAGEALGKAIAAMKDAEVAYAKLELVPAAGHHSQAIAAIRSAREAFPPDLAAFLGEAIALQEEVLGPLEEIVKAATGGLPETRGGSGFGKTIVDAVKDGVLKPLAKLIAPQHTEDARALGEEEEGVAWAANVLSQAQVAVPAAPAPQAPGTPPGGTAPGEPPALDEAETKELTEKLQAEAKTAAAAAGLAKDELAAGRAEPALAPAREALAALKQAADLLPKPPRRPEERLRELVEKQRAAEGAVEGLAGLEREVRAAAGEQLSGTQREDAKEAGAIATELGARPDEKAKKATEKVREGEGEVFASAEALARDRSEEAKLAVERDIKAFEEALAILSGQQDQEQQQQEQQEQQQKDQEQDKEGKKDREQKKQEGRYAMSPRDARLLRDEMDRKRREEEAKIFTGGSSVTVEKDW